MVAHGCFFDGCDNCVGSEKIDKAKKNWTDSRYSAQKAVITVTKISLGRLSGRRSQENRTNPTVAEGRVILGSSLGSLRAASLIACRSRASWGTGASGALS